MAIGSEHQIPQQTLERNVPLSQSLIWRRQRDFYVQRGIKAWSEDRVPEYITNNPFFAEIYAKIVFSFLQDCAASSASGLQPLVSAENPLRILELGAGTGKFSFLFLQRLLALMKAAGISSQAVCYVMTDCAENIVESWRGHSYLAQFVNAGVLEFDVLRAGEEDAFKFSRDGKRLPVSDAAPLIVIANYVFDSLPADVFAIRDGKLFETLITTTAPADQSAANASQKLADLKFAFENVPAKSDRYADPAWNATLERYRASLSPATVLFPSQALKTLEDLFELSDGRMLVLAADKGETNEEQLALAQGPPALEFHSSDCFSMMVNFDAIARVVTSQDGALNGRESKRNHVHQGHALLPDKHFSSLNICAFLQGPPDENFPATTEAYRQSQAAFGPDDLFTLLAWLNAHMEEMSVPQILSALRLTGWDTTAWMRLSPVLARQARSVIRERSDVRDAIRRVWSNFFPVTSADNAIAFQCGAVLLELRYFADASEMFLNSKKLLGSTAATSYNLGLCALGLERKTEALEFMEEACTLDPGFEPARTSRARLESANMRQS